MRIRASAGSAFRDGFAAILHEPALVAAELTWRWCFGISALLLATGSFALFLDSIKVSAVEKVLLQSWNPMLAWIALRHMFAGSLSRLIAELFLVAVGLTLLRCLAAAAGRSAILTRLAAMFRSDESTAPTHRFAPLFLLQMLRMAAGFSTAVLAVALFLYGTVMIHQAHATRAALALSFGVGLVLLIGLTLNWHFGIAPIFCIRNGVGVIDALDEAAAFSARQGGRLCTLGFGFSALGLVWAGTMFFATLSPLRLIGHAGRGWVVLGMTVAVLVYFAGADVLSVARLASYVSLAEDNSNAVPEPAPTLPASPISDPLEPMLGLA